MNVSVIIPTYNRPGFLRETLESVWAQSVLPAEIIIGDDSTNDETENLVKQVLIPISPVPIRYYHHKPSLKEVKNVDFQYGMASGELILHLHDDDPVYENCIKDLLEPFTVYPEIIASFGLQRIILENGSLAKDSEAVNKFFFRTAEREGIVNGFLAGAVAMFPNNGFLVKKEAAESVGYSDMGRAGKATDFYFGFRLGKIGKPFYFVNKFTATCRIVPGSQSRTGDSDNAYQNIRILMEDCKKEDLCPEIIMAIKNMMPIAITYAIKIRDMKNAFEWLFSKYYRRRLLSLRGMKRLVLAVNPF